MRKILLTFLLFCNTILISNANQILVPMDETQKNHLKSYGLTYWVLKENISEELNKNIHP